MLPLTIKREDIQYLWSELGQSLDMQIAIKTIHISLPESLIESAKTQAVEGKFSNMSDYVRTLIRDDIARREEQRLEQLLLTGVRSERGMTVGSEAWQAYRKRLVTQSKNPPSPKKS